LTGIGEVFGDRRYLVVLNDISQSLISADYVRGENWIAVRPDDDGRLFALTGLPGNAAAGWFDPATGELLAGPTPLSTPGTPLLLSDGSVMIGDDLGSLIVLNPTLDAPPRVVVERSGFVPHYQHRDGRVIAGDSDGVVLLVDLDSGVLTELVGLEGGVQDALISPDGRLAVAGTMDSLALFDLTTNTMIGRPIAVPRANGTPPGMSWTEDSRSVWINTATGPQRIDVHPDSWFERACAIVNRTLTVEEWRAFVSAEGEPIDSCS